MHRDGSDHYNKGDGGEEREHQQLLGRTQLHVGHGEGFEDSRSILS